MDFEVEFEHTNCEQRTKSRYTECQLNGQLLPMRTNSTTTRTHHERTHGLLLLGRLNFVRKQPQRRLRSVGVSADVIVNLFEGI